MASRIQGPSLDLASRGWVVLWLVAVPALAVSALLWLSQPPEPFTGEIVGSSVSESDDGLVGDVSWIDEDGVRRVRSFDLTEAQVASGTVLLISTENRVRVLDPSRDRGLSATTVAVRLESRCCSPSWCWRPSAALDSYGERADLER